MLVRADALGAEERSDAGSRVLAACPDSAERGDPWRWTVTLHETAGVTSLSVSADPGHIAFDQQSFTDGQSATLHRSAGRQLVIAALKGEALVSASDGPWQRWLSPGDVFIVEGEDREALALQLGAGDSAVDVVSLAPVTAHALRWVP